MSSGRFRFVGGSHELEELLAVLVDLHRSYPADLAESVRRLRPPDGDFEQRPIRKHHVCGDLLLARDARAQRSQLLEETCIGGARNELRRLGLRLSARRVGLAPLLTGPCRGRGLLPTRRVVGAEAVVAAAAVLAGG